MNEEVGAELRTFAAWESTPDEVLAVIAHKDEGAFTELYRRYLDPVYRYMRYQTPTSEEAQDLTAQVFFHAYRASDGFRGESTYRTWLFRIAHNTLISYRRSRGKAPIPVAELPESPDEDTDVFHRAAEAEAARTLWSVIRELPLPEREIVQLRYVEGLEPREIAEVTGRSPGAVRVRIHRLLRRLRRRLEEKGVQA